MRYPGNAWTHRYRRQARVSTRSNKWGLGVADRWSFGRHHLTTPWRLPVESRASGWCRRCSRGQGGRGFGLGFGGLFFTLQIALASLPFLNLVVLLAHKGLYIAERFRFFGRL